MARDPIEQIDLHLLRIAFPSSPSLHLWVDPLRDACREFGIDTVREVASFLANIAVESRDLTRLEESFNYSPERLRALFGRHRISDEQCRRLGRRPGEKVVPIERQRQIANVLYGGKWGRENLGNVYPDDGWLFRGCGAKQLTGRANYEKCAKALGMKVEDLPAYMRTREGACRSAGWFWKSHNLDAKAATPGVRDDRIAINGGTNGLEVVEPRFNKLVKELLRRGC